MTGVDAATTVPARTRDGRKARPPRRSPDQLLTGRRLTPRTERLLFGVIGFVGVIVLWELLSRIGILNPFFTSSPSEIWTVFAKQIVTDQFRGHLLISLAEWGLGYLLACVVGITVGLAAGWNVHSERAVMPFLTFLYAAPELAFIPLFIMWFGIGLTFKIFLVFLSAVFFVALNTLRGVRSTDRRYLDVASVFGAGSVRLFTQTILPGAVPYIVTGLRQASGRALVGMVAAEFLSANQGIGFFISISGSTFNTAAVMMGVAVIALFGVIVGLVLGRIERHFDRWRA